MGGCDKEVSKDTKEVPTNSNSMKDVKTYSTGAYLEEGVHFVGFVNKTVAISFDYDGKLYTLFFPVKQHFVITPLETETNLFKSKYEIIKFDVAKGTIDLQKIK